VKKTTGRWPAGFSVPPILNLPLGPGDIDPGLEVYLRPPVPLFFPLPPPCCGNRVTASEEEGKREAFWFLPSPLTFVPESCSVWDVVDTVEEDFLVLSSPGPFLTFFLLTPELPAELAFPRLANIRF